jgi:hypothetical protein
MLKLHPETLDSGDDVTTARGKFYHKQLEGHGSAQFAL